MVTLAEEAVRVREESLIRELLDRRTRPDAIKGYEVEFGEDHSGDPAVWIWLLVQDADSSSKELKNLVETLGPFSRAVGTELVEQRLIHWPYVRFRTWVQPAA